MKQIIPKILVFDSGLGGITILNAIRNAYPGCHFIYCTDNAAFPYGTKSETSLNERVSKVLATLATAHKPDIIVVACNTASTVVLPKIRSMISVPVVGVVPAIKPAAQLANTSHIGLLATPATIKRRYTNDLIGEFGKGLTWVKVGSSTLVEVAEKKMYGAGTIDPNLIRSAIEELNNVPAEKMDTVVLACTHFPLLKKELEVALPHIKHWIDSSDAIARRVGFWLHELGYLTSSSTEGLQRELVVTENIVQPEKIEQLLANIQFKISSTLILE